MSLKQTVSVFDSSVNAELSSEDSVVVGYFWRGLCLNKDLAPNAGRSADLHSPQILHLLFFNPIFSSPFFIVATLFAQTGA